MYAVGVIAMLELGRRVEHLAVKLLLEGILTAETVDTRPSHFDKGLAFLVREDVSAERWQAIVKVVRLRFRKAELPLYVKSGGSWKYAKEGGDASSTS